MQKSGKLDEDEPNTREQTDLKRKMGKEKLWKNDRVKNIKLNIYKTEINRRKSKNR